MKNNSMIIGPDTRSATVIDWLARMEGQGRSDLINACFEGKEIELTNGCFDIIHAGHVDYLIDIKARHPDCFLLVGINDDEAVRHLKGPGRPIQAFAHRASVVMALKPVDAVVAIGEDALDPLRAFMPDIYVKGGDYTLDTINQDERQLVEGYGGRVEIIASRAPYLSTSKIVEFAKHGGK